MLSNNKENIISGTCLLLSVSLADKNLEQEEINVISDIITDFFSIENQEAQIIISECINKVKESTDIYEFGKTLNNSFSYQDKVDFICCTYEVAFINKDYHYLEDHTIKKIATILNVEHQDLINAKKEMKNYLNQ